MKRLVGALAVSGGIHAVLLLGMTPSAFEPPRFNVQAGRSSVEMVFAAPARARPEPASEPTTSEPAPKQPPEEAASSPSDAADDPDPTKTDRGEAPAESTSRPDTAAETASETAPVDAPDTSRSAETTSVAERSASESSAPRAARHTGVKWVRDVSYRRNPPPRYPTKARVYGQEGVVKLLVTIGPDGHPRRVELYESSGHVRLDRAARKAVRRWEFVPARRDGEPVVSRTLVPVRFELDR